MKKLEWKGHFYSRAFFKIKKGQNAISCPFLAKLYLLGAHRNLSVVFFCKHHLGYLPSISGGHLGSNCPILAIFDNLFEALFNIYLKIEKTPEKSSPLMRSIWSYDLNFGLQSPKTGFYYWADIDEVRFGSGHIFIPSWHPKTKSGVSHVCWQANEASQTDNHGKVSL